jgi:hypothetical protein
MPDLLESVGGLTETIPGGQFTLLGLGLLAVPSVRRQLRPVAKAAVRGGLAITDQLKGFVAEAREQTSDLVAEVRSERAEGGNGSHEHESAAERRQRRSAPGEAQA